MPLGPIQKSIISYLEEHGPKGVYIGALTKDSRFMGLDLEQVERSLKKLEGRGLIYKEGIRYILSSNLKTKNNTMA